MAFKKIKAATMLNNSGMDVQSTKHPRGLNFLFTIEIWERFGFYIMSSIYVLYMDKVLHFDGKTIGTLYGLFLFASYMFPILGGWLGDRWLGRLRTIRAGAWCMATGYIALGLSSHERLPLFYLGLTLVAFGTGIFKVNMSAMLGSLYRDKPTIRDAGFNIYYMSVNLGATLGPLAANILGFLYNDYNLSFWAAAIGLFLSLLFLEIGKGQLPMLESAVSTSSVQSNSIAMPRKEFWQRVITLIGLYLIASLFWVPYYQNGMAITLFADRSTRAYSWLRPEIYIMFNAIFILLLTPPLLAVLRAQREKGKEPSTPVKILFGLVLMGLAMLFMVWAALAGGDHDVRIMSPFWLIGTYLVITIAEILVSPMGQSYVSKVAPPQVQGLMFGGWYGATALGALSSGLFGRFYEGSAHHNYFLVLAMVSFLAAILILLFMKNLQRFAQ
jgi:proton-dependent oligopeptide transporter, POT family